MPHQECPLMPYRCSMSDPLNFAHFVGKLCLSSVLIELTERNCTDSSQRIMLFCFFQLTMPFFYEI